MRQQQINHCDTNNTTQLNERKEHADEMVPWQSGDMRFCLISDARLQI
jgi:hypothetical protein